MVVCVNVFESDTPDEWKAIREACAGVGVPVALAEHFAKGGAGAEDLAWLVIEAASRNGKPALQFTYPDKLPLLEKVRLIARKIYGADDVVAEGKTAEKLSSFEEAGFGDSPFAWPRRNTPFPPTRADAGPPARIHRAAAQRPAERRARLCRCLHGGHHHHARPSKSARRGNDGCGCQRQHGGIVLRTQRRGGIRPFARLEDVLESGQDLRRRAPRYGGQVEPRLGDAE